MNTTSIFSQNSHIETGIYIKGDFKNQKSHKYDMNNQTAGNLQFEEKKAVVKSIFPTSAANKDITENHKYTIQQGDRKRLNEDGILRVYNLKKPIDIPVRSLLGNWKETHAGVTLVIANGHWCTEEKPVDTKPEPIVLAVLKSILKFALA